MDRENRAEEGLGRGVGRETINRGSKGRDGWCKVGKQSLGCATDVRGGRPRGAMGATLAETLTVEDMEP